jgi:hypothetical protein
MKKSIILGLAATGILLCGAAQAANNPNTTRTLTSGIGGGTTVSGVNSSLPYNSHASKRSSKADVSLTNYRSGYSRRPAQSFSTTTSTASSSQPTSIPATIPSQAASIVPSTIGASSSSSGGIVGSTPPTTIPANIPSQAASIVPFTTPPTGIPANIPGQAAGNVPASIGGRP